MPLVTLEIGNKRYGISGSFLQKYPGFPPPKPPFSSIIILQGIHEDAGHTLVHFLYTGEYETINAPLDEDTSDIAREYKKSLFVYQASRKYGIDTLEAHAQKFIRRFGDSLSFPDLLRITRDVFSTLPEGETWLPCYINTRLQHMLEPSKILRSLEDLYNSLGQNHHFDSIVLKMVVEILSVSYRGRTPEDETVAIAEAIATEEPACKDGSPAEPACEEDIPLVEESAYEDVLLAEPACEEDVPFVEESPPKDVPLAEPTYEEDVPLAEPACEEGIPLVEEPAYKDVLLVENVCEEDVALAQPACEEDVPLAEESAHEDAPSVEGPLVEEAAFAGDSHRVEAPTTSIHSSAAESLPINGSTETVQAHLVTASVQDFAIYGDWRKLTPAKKASKAIKLTEKGLPIPNKDGLVQIFTAGVRT